MQTSIDRSSPRKAQGRRRFLQRATVGLGLAAGGLALFESGARPLAVRAQGALSERLITIDDAVTQILSIARTAEQLAVTFYSNGIANASALGLSGDDLAYLKAALVEEQIHQQFFTANGGQSLADTFSFPKGAQTFSDLKTFIETQQQLEGVFDSAFLAAIKEFAAMGRPDLAQVAGQIACIEAEHRALGRVIGGLSPADNWAFTPVLIATVADAPQVVQDAGYLSPTEGNSYRYHEVSTEDAGVEQRVPFVASSGVGRG
ncbi:ferritin-like domain-containing protein [Thermogemmatispora onikobensis]|uniref:ferritin-like domain-containing protein n=1 Tax=Thermogemmatispora onikobensis TaxID=732234 RepID=UPI0008536CB5|nr:ferritin-like domain-containing protein [Thermogemmatispora onikobensis]